MTSHGFFKLNYIHTDAGGWFYSANDELLHCFVNSGLKIFLSTLLANARGNVFKNLELFTPAKIDLGFGFDHFTLAEVTFRNHEITWPSLFANRPPTLPDQAHTQLQPESLPLPIGQKEYVKACRRYGQGLNNWLPWDRKDSLR